MPSKMSQLRALDAQIVQHVIERGKMFDKREQLVKSLLGTPELKGYQAELAEWLEAVKGGPNG